MLRRLIYPVPDYAGTEHETTTGGTHLLHRPAPRGGRTVVYLHGNGSDLASIAPLAELFARHGLGFAAIEYPGYGPAAGQRISQAGILAAAADGLDHLREGGLAAADTLLVGESLGSAVAAHLAADGHLQDGEGGGRLVLVSPFISMTAMVRRVVRAFPRLLVPDRWETDALADRVTVPTLLVHGAQDSLVPPQMSAVLGSVIPDARRVLVEGRDHNTLWEAPSECLDVIVDFAG
ncbi:alpha/beta hydrolase [Janibacter alittae]|uniref:Alpha/beta fold hydrolase n=1 Tax=Janibacter alittae TaxID=3115209 RepID=A0ABZ2MGX2_9MICO